MGVSGSGGAIRVFQVLQRRNVGVGLLPRRGSVEEEEEQGIEERPWKISKKKNICKCDGTDITGVRVSSLVRFWF